MITIDPNDFARQLCEHMGGTYDEHAVALVVRMEKLLEPHLHADFSSILNAIEIQVDASLGHPTVLRHLGEALLAAAAVHHLDERTVKRLTQTLGELHGHVDGVAARRAAAR